MSDKPINKGPHDLGGEAAGPVDTTDHGMKFWEKQANALRSTSLATGSAVITGVTAVSQSVPQQVRRRLREALVESLGADPDAQCRRHLAQPGRGRRRMLPPPQDQRLDKAGRGQFAAPVQEPGGAGHRLGDVGQHGLDRGGDLWETGHAGTSSS